MADANKRIAANDHTASHTIAGDVLLRNPLIAGPNDGVVGTWSAEWPAEGSSLGRTRHYHNSLLHYKQEFNLARDALLSVSGDAAGQAAAAPDRRAVPERQLALLETGHLGAGQTRSYAVPLPGLSPIFGVSWTAGQLELTLIAPDGSTYRAGDRGVTATTVDGPVSRLQLLHLDPALQQAGFWRLVVTAAREPVDYLALAGESGPVLVPAFTIAGDTATIGARVHWQGAPELPLQVVAYMRGASGRLSQVRLEPAANGHYQATLPLAGMGSGPHPVVLCARSTAVGRPLVRYAFGAVAPAPTGAPRPPAPPPAPEPGGRLLRRAPALAGPVRVSPAPGGAVAEVALRITVPGFYAINGRLGDQRASIQPHLPAGTSSVRLFFPGAVAAASLCDLSAYNADRPRLALVHPGCTAGAPAETAAGDPA